MQRFWRLRLALPLLMAMAAPCMALAAEPAPMATRSAVTLPNLTAEEPAPLPDSLEPPGLLAPDNVPDGKIHGEVSASVGTSGYREGSVFLTQQLPNGTSFAIAVDAAQISPGRNRHDRTAPPQPAAN